LTLFFFSLHLRHQQEVEGRTQATGTSHRILTTDINVFNADPCTSVAPVSTAQRLLSPLTQPDMTEQQPSGPRPTLSGIPSYSSQVEGLSVSQAVVNDVLIDLQSKVINDTLQQYQDQSSTDAYLGKKTKRRFMFRCFSLALVFVYIFRTYSSDLYTSTTANVGT
jgi:hypothetical protein